MADPKAKEGLKLPGFTFDQANGDLRRSDGTRVALRPQCLAVLACLAESADRVVSKQVLMDAVWPGLVVTDDSLVQCIKELRRTLGDAERRIIRTEPKRGYRLVSAPACVEVADTARAVATSFTQDIRYATTVDGTRIAYAKAGMSDGPALVRAAHWMTHLDWDWRCPVIGARLRRLVHHFQLWRYDGRGSGLSSRDVAQPTLDEAVADLEAVVDAAGLQRFGLLGPSGGASIALSYTAKHPDRVNRLILIGGHARGLLKRGAHAKSREYVMALARIIEEGWGQDNPAFRQIFTSLLFPGANEEQMQAFNHMQRQSCSPSAAADLVRKTAEYDASGALARIHCPTLVLHNPDDQRVPFAEAQLIASSVPGARLETFESRNHTALPGEPAFESTLYSIIDFALEGAHERDQPSAGPSLHVVEGSRRRPVADRAAEGT